ncbi:sugar phosphate exchanger 3 isoform X2 [Aplysia californica]|uniref:Sugar phosphate exchanger 3 n=1 Tax=Aplysia californica TaxID=6500 RepID=A0ABM0JF45_APLCA|nr:sugar phosphate exchanger 3 isoform X2 [Aplysia californica]
MAYKFTRRDSHKVSVFILTFFSYAFFHANRKAFSNVKTSTGRVWTPSFHNASEPELKPDYLWNAHHLFNSEDSAEQYQGILDTVFMLAYAVGLFLNGYVGDRVNMRILLTIGMASSSVMVFIFGCVCEWATFYNKYFYAFIWILNGLMQSTGWPVVVACMGNWFGQSSRGVLLGLWSSCASVGNIIGALLVSSVLSYGYQYAFLMTSTVLFAASFMIFFGLIPSPQEVGLESVEDDENRENQRAGSTSVNSEEQIDREPLLSDTHDEGATSEGATVDPDDVTYNIETTRPASLSFLKACLLPGVIPYALAYAFLKLVNYSFFFWLPFYLNNAFKWKESEADQLSTAYDVAGIVGGTLIGFISDRLGKRTVLIVPMLILSIPSLFMYGNSPNNVTINIVLMSLVGFFIGGAANLISAAVSADLGCQKALRGDDKALATVTGVIDGTGSFGAALGQIAVPYLQTGLGWHSVFYLFMICMFLTMCCLFPLFIKELRSLRCCCRRTRGSVSLQHEDGE